MRPSTCVDVQVGERPEHPSYTPDSRRVRDTYTIVYMEGTLSNRLISDYETRLSCAASLVPVLQQKKQNKSSQNRVKKRPGRSWDT